MEGGRPRLQHRKLRLQVILERIEEPAQESMGMQPAEDDENRGWEFSKERS